MTIAAQHGDVLGKAIAHDGGNMSGYYALLHVLTGLFGNSLLAIRLPSVIATGATVAIVCVLALRLFDRRVASIAGLLTAVSLPLVYWGQSARGYAALTALVAASCLAFVALIDGAQSTRWAKAAYVISTTLAIYASFVAVLIVPAQLLTLLWHRRSARPLASALIACALCCVPLAVLAAVRGSGQLFWVPRPNLTADTQMLESLASASLEPSFRTRAPGVVLTALLIVAIAVAIGRRAIGPVAQRPTPGHVLVLAWLVVPVALAWLESLVAQPIFLPRNLLFTLPAVALLLAVGLGDRHRPPVAVWGAVAALILLRALPLAASYGVSPEDWKATTSYVLARAQPGDCIAFYPSDARMAFAYYLGRRAPGASRSPRSILPAAPWSPPRPYVEDYATLPGRDLKQLPARCPRLWLVSSHEGQPDGPAGSRANYARYLALRSTLAAAYSNRRALSFGYAAVVHVALLSAPRERLGAGRPGA